MEDAGGRTELAEPKEGKGRAKALLGSGDRATRGEKGDSGIEAPRERSGEDVDDAGDPIELASDGRRTVCRRETDDARELERAALALQFFPRIGVVGEVGIGEAERAKDRSAMSVSMAGNRAIRSRREFSRSRSPERAISRRLSQDVSEGAAGAPRVSTVASVISTSSKGEAKPEVDPSEPDDGVEIGGGYEEDVSMVKNEMVMVER
ncbi:hypothetical protein B0H17DRAFT_1141985 [Mycena rosella]|uniref:Uncharacterized protein n=1 Tax=Mycena rosella TaxID=1033263 RepID=A0AAD7G9U0_MYCRO|nr:hypothetical protein B0H17DRAFT_1141985 [Mycena rosella]